MRIEVERDARTGIITLAVDNGDSKKPSVIAHTAPDYYREALDLAASEVKRRGEGWALVNRIEETKP